MQAILKLVAVNCSSCGRRLAETLPGAAVYCPSCDRWTRPAKPKPIQPVQQALFAMEGGMGNGDDRQDATVSR